MSEDDDDDDDEEGEGANEDREDGASTNINNRTVRVSDECLALVFENLLKLLQQSSPVELAHNTSQLLRLLAAQPRQMGLLLLRNHPPGIFKSLKLLFLRVGMMLLSP